MRCSHRSLRELVGDSADSMPSAIDLRSQFSGEQTRNLHFVSATKTRLLDLPILRIGVGRLTPPEDRTFRSEIGRLRRVLDLSRTPREGSREAQIWPFRGLETEVSRARKRVFEAQIWPRSGLFRPPREGSKLAQIEGGVSRGGPRGVVSATFRVD
jgi:hypothetical protein